MGKTHLTGLEIGDVGLDIWASPALNQKVRIGALNTQMRLHTQEGAHIVQVRVVNPVNALVVATINIGTGTVGGARSDVFTGSSSAGAPLTVEKYVPPGFYYVELTAGAPVLYVIVSFIAALNA